MNKLFSKNKKGISTIIATILMVLFVIIASGIVWTVIQNILSEKTTEIGSSLTRIILTVSESSVVVGSSNVTLVVNRDIGPGDLAKVKIILFNSAGESYSEDADATGLGELGSKKFSVSLGSLSDVAKISVAPIITDSSGKESLQRVTSTYKVSN